MFSLSTGPRPGAGDDAVRLAMVALALASGSIHSTLGGLLFTLNAMGYAVAAAALVLPIVLAVRFRWLVRLGLIAYTVTTILGWAIQGPYYSTAFVAKAIEVGLWRCSPRSGSARAGPPPEAVALAPTPSSRLTEPHADHRSSHPMKRIASTIALVAIAAAIAACSAGGAATPAPSTDPSSPRVVAQDLAFVDRELELEAGTATLVAFENRDGAPHNITIARDEAFNDKVFEGAIVSSSTVTYRIPALTSGSYVFRCDVHPDMPGTVAVG